MSARAFESHERKVLVLPPTRRDGDVTCALLRDVGLDCAVVANANALASQIGAPIGAIVMTDAAVSDPGLPLVLQAIDSQPQWSDLPVILLSRVEVQSEVDKERFEKLTNLTLLDRPTSSRALVSAVAAAIRAREREGAARSDAGGVIALVA